MVKISGIIYIRWLESKSGPVVNNFPSKVFYKGLKAEIVIGSSMANSPKHRLDPSTATQIVIDLTNLTSAKSLSKNRCL